MIHETRRQSTTIRAAALLGLAVCGLSAFAADGRIEINQTCAVNTGCFPGDSPGFPVTIPPVTVPEMTLASFVLTSALLAPEDTDGIVIGGAFITMRATVDLNGFTLNGGCPSNESACSSAAIRILSDGVEVKNGVAAFFGNGIVVSLAGLPSGLRLSDIRLLRHQHDCILIENGGNNWIESITIANCRDHGINLVNTNATIVNVTSRNNVVGLTIPDGSIASVRSSVFLDPTPMVVDGTLVELGPNTCGADTTCP